jgi:alpha-galactosidase
LELAYTTFRDQDVIARSTRLTNRGSEPISIEKLASFSTDLNPDDYRLLKLSGASIRERQEETMDLKQGIVTVSSRLGASGHEQNPFVALMKPETTEAHGEAYGFSLLYSGSFSAEAEQNRNRFTRLVMGLNPFSFQWKLQPGESFQTPEALGVYSSTGLDGLTRQLHQVFNQHLIRSPWRDKPRPILLNTWEAVGPDVTHQKVLDMARSAKDLGVELIVLDDGWFGTKYPRTGKDALGDWTENPAKLPRGLKGLADDINRLGLMFGVWMEPEMVSPRSELFERHPDWIIRQAGRTPTAVKDQYILDLGRPDVQDYLITAISKVLDSGNIQYLKWDMNRTMTEVGSAALPPDRQRETQHRYILGLYRVLTVLTRKYPNVLFEGCAGGGGRFDPGMLQYFPQIWASDNSDGVSRLNIQAGTARAYPAMTMGAHVSPVPSGQVWGRTTSLKFRFHVAMAGNLGLELDPAELSPEEKTFARQQIAFYKQVRHLVQAGDYHLLRSPFAGNWPAWMFARPDKKEALVFAFQKLADTANAPPPPAIRLTGLDEKRLYSVSGISQPLSGAYLMNIGLSPRFEGDFDSTVYHIRPLA